MREILSAVDWPKAALRVPGYALTFFAWLLCWRALICFVVDVATGRAW